MASEDTPEGSEASGKAKAARRKIQGNLPYTSSAGVLRQVLDRIPTVEKPSVFNTDFLATVLQASGGSARPIPPILKAAGLLSQSGEPTELYSQFQTNTGRPAAALRAMKNAFAEVYRRNQFAHTADEATLTDVVVAATGLPKTDNIVRYIVKTFQALQAFAKGAVENPAAAPEPNIEPATSNTVAPENASQSRLGLVYNINVVLPETTNVDVYNAIFKSLKGNMLS